MSKAKEIRFIKGHASEGMCGEEADGLRGCEKCGLLFGPWKPEYFGGRLTGRVILLQK